VAPRSISARLFDNLDAGRAVEWRIASVDLPDLVAVIGRQKPSYGLTIDPSRR
jgi:hypothetical protein